MRMARRLETERLVLRLPVAEDFPAYQEYCASKRAEYVGGPFDIYTAFTRLSALVGHWELRGFG